MQNRYEATIVLRPIPHEKPGVLADEAGAMSKPNYTEPQQKGTTVLPATCHSARRLLIYSFSDESSTL